MIEEITIKFSTELKPTQDSWKSQLYIKEWCDYVAKEYLRTHGDFDSNNFLHTLQHKTKSPGQNPKISLDTQNWCGKCLG